MKKFSILFLLIVAVISGHAQSPAIPVKDSLQLSTGKPVMVVDAACGECKLGLKGKSCDLAVRIDGKAYFVDGTNIDSHGDAHAREGFCNAVRKAEVQGEIVNGRFKASYFKLLPTAPIKTVEKAHP